MANSKTILIIRVICLSALAFFLIGSYAISRPTIDSLFLEHYSSDYLPGVWLVTACFAAVVMTAYNRYNTRYPLLKIFGIATILSALSLIALLLSHHYQVPGSIYVLYLWKEIYMVLLVEIFWSFSDVIFNIKSARWIYGIILGIGSIGGFIGNLLIGPLAQAVGTINALWFNIPVLFTCWLVSMIFVALAQDPSGPKNLHKKIPKWDQSLKLIQKSTYLLPLLFLVGTVQITISLIDYQFNDALLINYPDTDTRTAVIGRTHAFIDLIALFFQFLSGPILRAIGVTGALLSIPLILGTTAFLFILIPRFFMAVSLKITSKCFDYSLFRASKEILYIPLHHDEKIQGKALIDILVYRIAKGFSSIILIGLVYFNLTNLAIYLTIIFLMIWAFLTYVIAKRYRSLVSAEEEFIGNSK